MYPGVILAGGSARRLGGNGKSIYRDCPRSVNTAHNQEF